MYDYQSLPLKDVFISTNRKLCFIRKYPVMKNVMEDKNCTERVSYIPIIPPTSYHIDMSSATVSFQPKAPCK